MPPEDTAKPKRKFPLVKVIYAFIIIGIVCASAGLVYYFYTQNQKTVAQLEQTKKQTDAENGKEDVAALVKQVGNLIELPANETPTVATITDIEKIKDQAFFTKAQNGDKVLIFSSSKKAYLFRPSQNKLIEVAPVSLNQPSTPSAQTTKPTLPPPTSTPIPPSPAGAGQSTSTP